ncbi:hypothetical protein NDU88_001585 [Pleurodeles waltl]|uniref:Uncharacterized protein n=1 Tax=Pleurodeles waltl TaxID=8319 RepID=A0AAV7P771_PLEWA|nr:hypothetical protein NDU88_001585 [Pleurodeles waltl]
MRPTGLQEWWAWPTGAVRVRCGAGGSRELDCGGPPQERERNPPASRNRRGRARRGRKGSGANVEAVAHAPDLEQLIQERREAIQSAAAISASPAESESETENSQPPSDRPTTPDRLSELGFQECPSVTPATADELF